MRLLSAEFWGYRRFVHARVDTDSRLVALIGPNEAGKSSLLDGLEDSTTASPSPPNAGPADPGDPVR
jgi:predicted ATP-dependent endonuclease of OLD family